MAIKKISKMTFLKNKKQLQELYKLGRKYDKETDPVKKVELEKEIIRRSEELKGKMKPVECTEEDLKTVVGPSAPDADNTEEVNLMTENQ